MDTFLDHAGRGSFPVQGDKDTGAAFVAKGKQRVIDCTIKSGASASAIVDLGAFRLVGIVTPATFEGTILTPKASTDGVTALPIQDATGAAKTITGVVVNAHIVLSPADFYGVQLIQMSMNSGPAGADRVLKLICEA